MRLAILSMFLTLPAMLGGCRGDRSEGADSAAGATAARVSGSAATTPPPAPAQITVAELEGFARGLRVELDSIQAAQERKMLARTGRDSLAAMVAASDGRTIPAGAMAAELPEIRYREVRRWAGDLLRARSASATVTAMSKQVDTTSMPPELRARVRESMERLQQMGAAEQRAYAGMPEPLARDVRRMVPRLDTLWNKVLAARLEAGK